MAVFCVTGGGDEASVVGAADGGEDAGDGSGRIRHSISVIRKRTVCATIDRRRCASDGGGSTCSGGASSTSTCASTTDDDDDDDDDDDELSIFPVFCSFTI